MIPVSRLGLSANASGARNAARLNAGCASVDDGSVITVGKWYPLDEGVVRIRRGNLELRGAGSQRSGFTYTSCADTTKEIGPGNCITVGLDQPPADAAGLVSNVTVRGLGFRDLNRIDIPSQGHNPSAVEAQFVENFLLSRCDGRNVKGNGVFNVLGWQTDDTTPVTRLIRIEYCTGGGDDGDSTQGDLINGAASHELQLVGNATTGGIRRHFMECGAGVHVLTVEDNIGDLQGVGMAHLGSFTVCERASIRRNRFTDWGKDASSIAVNPDSPDLPVVNVECEDNELTATMNQPLAAIIMSNGQLANHTYRRNTLRCILPFYVPKQPDGLTIDDNDYYPDQDGRPFVAPADAKFVGSNRTHKVAA